MAQFLGQLNVNAIQSALYNMIISQDIIGGSIKANYNLVDKAKEEAGLYGDTKLYIDTPNLTPVVWTQDSEDARNVLALHRPGAPKTQALTIDKFFQVRLTKDAYLSKQAFGTEGAFIAYQSVLDSRLPKGKEVHLNKLYNTFIGTNVGFDTTDNTKKVRRGDGDVSHPVTEVYAEINTAAGNNSTGENIAYSMANLIDDMKDYNTKYTPNGFERAFGDEDIRVVWNNKYVNAVKKIDLPSVFHDDALQSTFVGETLPARYFGKPNAHTTSQAGDRATHDLYLTTTVAGDTYVAAGDLIPAGLTITAGDAYTVDDKIICKVFTKLPPVLSAFSVGTDFFNAKNLSTNMYLTYGFNTFELLDSEACVTVYDTAE